MEEQRFVIIDLAWKKRKRNREVLPMDAGYLNSNDCLKAEIPVDHVYDDFEQACDDAKKLSSFTSYAAVYRIGDRCSAGAWVEYKWGAIQLPN